MPESRRRPKPPKLLTPENYNIGDRGAFYRVYAQPLVPAQATGHPFRFKRVFDITSMVESIQWQSNVEEAGAVTGSIQLRNPGNFLGVIVPGSKVIVKARNPFIVNNLQSSANRKQRYATVLEFIVRDRDKQVTEIMMNLTLADRLSYLKTGDHDFNYTKRKGKKAPTASSIITDVCRKKSVPFNATSIPRTTLPINKATQESGTILDFIVSVLKKHNQLVDKKNGKLPPPANWEIHMRTGVLTVRPKRPPTSVWAIDERYFMSEPSYSESIEDLATRIVVTGKNEEYEDKASETDEDGETTAKKKVKKPVKATAQNEQMIRVYGLIEKQVKLDGKVTPERAQRVANAELAKATRAKREFTFRCPALPNIWPSSKVNLYCPSYGMQGLFTVKSIDYQISGEDGPMMTLTVDAGAVASYVEAAPRIVPVKATKLFKTTNRNSGIFAGRTVGIYWDDKSSLLYTHPKRYRVAKVEIVRSASLPEHERPTKGETVLITYTRKVRGGRQNVTVRIRNKVTFGRGLVAVTAEGYIPTSNL